MKNPVDIVSGRVVDYDPLSQELTIKARYPDWPTLVKREYQECAVQLIDNRKVSDKQRRMCYALIRDISDFTGMGTDMTKEYVKQRFVDEELQDSAIKDFSLSDAPMSLVCSFQRWLVRFMVDWEVPSKKPLLNYVDDMQDYLYACLVSKKCCICGKQADLHHEDAVGAGRDREDIVHEGMSVLPLCREHHTEAHTMGRRSFNAKYHIDRGITLDRTLCRLYNLKSREGSEDAQ